MIPGNSDRVTRPRKERRKMWSWTRQEVLSACCAPGTVLGAVVWWACLYFPDQKSSQKLRAVNYSVGNRTKVGVIPKPVFFRADVIYVG